MTPPPRSKPGEIEKVQLDLRPSSKELEGLKRRLLSLWGEIYRRLQDGTSPRPFLIATPLGMERQGELERLLSEHGLSAAGRQDVPDWPSTATLIYVHSLEARRLHTALGFEFLWRRFFPEGAAQRWFLATRGDYEKLVQLKPKLRASLPNLTRRVKLPAFSFTARLHPFHASDPQDLAAEACGLDLLADNHVRCSHRTIP